MVSVIRHLARPLSALLLVVLLAPAAVVECAGTALGGMDAVTCCHRSTDVAAMDPNCCAMRQHAPEPTQPATPVASGSSDQSFAVALLPAVVPVVVAPSVSAFAETVNTGPVPLDPLYLRLSAIRR
jgi:hypothetical protein